MAWTLERNFYERRVRPSDDANLDANAIARTTCDHVTLRCLHDRRHPLYLHQRCEHFSGRRANALARWARGCSGRPPRENIHLGGARTVRPGTACRDRLSAHERPTESSSSARNRASLRATRSGSGVRVVCAEASTTARAVAASMRQLGCTASGRAPRRVRSQQATGFVAAGRRPSSNHSRRTLTRSVR
jgi:hypothetical protein